jgi:hypothetical protein
VEETVVLAGLCIIYNLAKEEDGPKYLRDMEGLVDLLKAFVNKGKWR